MKPGAPTDVMTLSEPIFGYVCRLNRIGRRGLTKSPESARADLEALLDEASSRASATPGLRSRFEEAAEVLRWFVDAMVFNSSFPFDERQWTPMSHSLGQGSAVDQFLDKLDETLRRQGPEADDLLAVFYSCLGLGFGGRLVPPGEVERKMDQLRPRMAKRASSGRSSRICEEAYNPDGRDLTGRVGLPLTLIAVVLLVLTVGLYAINAAAYSRALSEIEESINAINAEAQPEASRGGE